MEKLITLNLKREHFLLSHCASNDETRYHLNGIHVNLETGLVYSTDGHILSRLTFDNKDLEKPDIKKIYLINTTICKSILKQKNVKKDDIFVIKLNEKTNELHYIDNESHIKYIIEEVQEIHIQNMIPKYSENRKKGIINIGIDPLLIYRLSKAADIKPPKSYFEFILPTNNTSPITIKKTGSENDFVGVIMPIRLNNKVEVQNV